MIAKEKQHSPMPFLIVIVGPTAVGKTGLSLGIAKRFDGEIISGDANAVYRYMDIGTAKPTEEERQKIKHHLVDIVDPDEIFTVALFQRMAYRVIEDIIDRSKVPLLVGGTGLYIYAVVEGWKIPEVKPNWELRKSLERATMEKGELWLHQRLKAVDPDSAMRIHPRNIRRVIRALEVYEETGVSISQLQTKEPPAYQIIWIGLTRYRAELHQRIDKRVDLMIEQGFVDEIKSLLARGYSPDSPAMSAIGYRQIIQYLQGEIGLDTAIAQTKKATRRLARQQYGSWFRLNDPRIHWFDVSDQTSFERICQFLISCGLVPK